MNESQVIKEIASQILVEKDQEWGRGALFILDTLSKIYPDLVKEIYFQVTDALDNKEEKSEL